MSRACATCEWWRSSGLGGAPAEGAVRGECREAPPVASFEWPDTNPTDWCSRWRLAQRLSGGVDRRAKA